VPVELPFGLIVASDGDGRLRVCRRRPQASGADQGQAGRQKGPQGPVSQIGLTFNDAGELVPDGSLPSQLSAEGLVAGACSFDLYPSAVRAIEELLALQLDAGVKHFQRAQQEKDPQAQRVLPILAAQKAARRQLRQALLLVQSDEGDATAFAVGVKSLSANYCEEMTLSIALLSGMESFLLQAGTWMTRQALGHPLTSDTVLALVTFSAVAGQLSASRGLLEDALQYWD